jgi:cobalamin biosynthesis Mg chelatase CobN
VDERGFDDFGERRDFDDNPGANDVMASPTASASATSGATGTPTATATATSRASDDDRTSSAATVLPDTGGVSLMPLVSVAALVLLVGSGVVATRLVRLVR